MAKAVFRPGELIVLPDKVTLSVPTDLPDLAHLVQAEEDDEAEDEVEVYTGPTADDLRREAEEFRIQWESEREAMIQAAKDDAEDIILKARETASAEMQKREIDAEVVKAMAQEEAEKIIAAAQQQALVLETETRSTLEGEKKEALEQGREAGRVEGYAEGRTEVDRLIERTHVVLERAQNKRGEILADTEQEIIDLVLLIARKVVKVISETQRGVIVSNVVQALRKVKDRGNIIIRVNIADLKLTTEHTRDFIQMLEGSRSIQVLEDSSVDPGGCIIETDFGEIDARISSQLAELESKILEISPIKPNPKPNAPQGTAPRQAAAPRPAIAAASATPRPAET